MKFGDDCTTFGIVEDELIESEAMACFIERTFPQAKVIWRMDDGASGLAAVKRESPDIIIIDIEMPVMNGLELCKHLYDLPFRGVILINTAYDKFSYAKRAISLKAFDYIVKPTNNDDLRDALGRCIEEAESRKSEYKYRQELDDTMQSMRQYAASLLTSTVNQKNPEHLLYRAFGQNTSENLQAYVVHILSKTAFSTDEMHAFESIRQQSAGYIISADYVCDRHYIVIIQAPEGQSLARIYTHIWTYALLCLHSADNACADISPLCTDSRSVAREYQTAPALPQNLAETVTSRIVLPQRTWRVIRRMDLEKIRGRFARQLQSCQFERLKKSLEGVLFQYGNNPKEVYWEIAQLLLEAVIGVWPYIPLRQIAADLFTDDPESMVWFHDLLNICTKMPRPENGDVVDSALHIMETSFSQDISQTDIAEKLGLNTTYFSRLFKKRTGKNFSDVLTDMRMRHAEKMLLENPNCSLEELCKSCGLSSRTYFSEVFKKWKGMTITQFLKNQNPQG